MDWTWRQRKFVRYYVADPMRDAAKAARQADYAAESSKQKGYALLHWPEFKHIQDAIAEADGTAQHVMAEELALTAKNVLRKIQNIHDFNKDNPAPGAQAVALKAAELLGKHLRLFNDDATDGARQGLDELKLRLQEARERS